MADNTYDLAVIGGGINGTGIAADAAGRGLRVVLAEAEDLGGATSSASSKLIHGGLRYLEHYAFRLVREALSEREVLMAKAPHIIWPMRFVLPHVDGMRPAPLLRAGLFLYDHLAKRRTLPASSSLDLAPAPAGRALKPEFRRAFTYWDCWVDDARLVIANAIAARDKGAEILTRTPVTAIATEAGHWTVTLGSGADRRDIRARAIVNAAGPWVSAVARLVRGAHNRSLPHVNLIKGSHIVVPRIEGAGDAFIFQNRDGRVVFALPFEHAFTLIGTTDVRTDGDPRDVSVSLEEEDYLLALANRFFRKPLTVADIVWRFAGVRPLDDDGSDDPASVTRDYRLDLNAGPPAMLHVIGGKITTYRRLAEAGLDKLAPHLSPMGPAWTAGAPLPGGDVGERGFEAWLSTFQDRHPGFDPADLARLARRYGTRLGKVIGDAQNLRDLGADLGGGLSQREVAYLAREEWARRPEDVLWRRTKAGLRIPAAAREAASERILAVLERA